MNKILILNGPNLNLLGTREPEIYGWDTLDDINEELEIIAENAGFKAVCKQSNSEGEIVSMLQDVYLSDEYIAVIINAAAYTHTSIAIMDTLKIFSIPIYEVHITNPKQRESFRHHSYIELVATKTFAGEGKNSYIKALNDAIENYDPDKISTSPLEEDLEQGQAKAKPQEEDTGLEGDLDFHDDTEEEEIIEVSPPPREN